MTPSLARFEIRAAPRCYWFVEQNRTSHPDKHTDPSVTAMQIYDTPQDGNSSFVQLTHKSTTYSGLWATDSCQTTLNCTAHWQRSWQMSTSFTLSLNDFPTCLSALIPHNTRPWQQPPQSFLYAWDAGTAHSVTYIPVTEPLQLPFPAVEQQIPAVLLFGQGAEAVTHYDTAAMLSLWLWGLSAPVRPGVGTANVPVVWFREFVLDTTAIPVTVPEIHHHAMSIISYYVCTMKLMVKNHSQKF